MRAAIRYVPEGIVLDLGRQDLGHPDGRKILERHYRQSERSHPEFNGQNPAFVCLRHDSGTSPGMFLRRIGDQWWACHYERSRCGSIRVPAPMSDEHKRQADYWARSGPASARPLPSCSPPAPGRCTTGAAGSGTSPTLTGAGTGGTRTSARRSARSSSRAGGTARCPPVPSRPFT